MSEGHESPINPELPKNIREFLESNQKEIRRESEAREMRIEELAGKSATEEDKEEAKALIDEEIRSSEAGPAFQHAQDGFITFIPRNRDKNPMIAVSSEDEDVYDLFNRAAGRATKELSGFHQIGHSNRTGYTAWEMWKDSSKKSWELVNEVFEEAKKQAAFY